MITIGIAISVIRAPLPIISIEARSRGPIIVVIVVVWLLVLLLLLLLLRAWCSLLGSKNLHHLCDGVLKAGVVLY